MEPADIVPENPGTIKAQPTTSTRTDHGIHGPVFPMTMRILPRTIGPPSKLLDFEAFDRMINDLRIELALLLQDNYNRHVIINFGGLPQITSFLHKVYDHVPKFLIPLTDGKLMEEADIHNLLYPVIQALKERPLDVEMLRGLLEAATRLTDVLMWTMLNNEMVRRFFHKYLEIFDKNCYDELLKYDESLGGRMHELLIHPRLLNQHHLIKHLLEARGLPPVPEAEGNTEGLKTKVLQKQKEIAQKRTEAVQKKASEIANRNEVASKKGTATGFGEDLIDRLSNHSVPVDPAKPATPAPSTAQPSTAEDSPKDVPDNPPYPDTYPMVQADYTQLMQLPEFRQLQLQLAKQEELISHNEAWLLQSVWIKPGDYHDVTAYELQAQELATFDMDSDAFFRVCANQPRPDMEEKQEEPIVSKVPETYNWRDLYMILATHFLSVMTNYGLIMTTWLYLLELGVDPHLAGLVQAVTPASAFAMGFLTNYITRRKRYYWPFLLEQFLMTSGCVLYFISGYWKERSVSTTLEVMMAGRILIGFGEGSVLTRKWIATGVQPWAMEKWSGLLCLLGGVALCVGPGLNALLTFYQGGSSIGAIPLYEYTIFAFTMALVWALHMIMTSVYFTGTSQIETDDKTNAQRIKGRLIQFFRGVKNKQMRVLLDLGAIEDDRDHPPEWSEAVQEAIGHAALQRQITIPKPKTTEELEGQHLLGHLAKQAIDATAPQAPLERQESGVLEEALGRRDSGVVVINTVDKQTGPKDEVDPNSHIILNRKGKIKDPQSENISPIIDVKYPTRWAIFCMAVIVLNKVY